jgi:hypothetical protein
MKFPKERDDELIGIEFERRAQETEVGVLLIIHGRNVWLPKSQIDMREWSSIVGIPRVPSIPKSETMWLCPLIQN